MNLHTIERKTPDDRFLGIDGKQIYSWPIISGEYNASEYTRCPICNTEQCLIFSDVRSGSQMHMAHIANQETGKRYFYTRHSTCFYDGIMHHTWRPRLNYDLIQCQLCQFEG